MRPRINWGDDDDNSVPPENDQSIDAQWLRIINGTPPSRAPILPASAPKEASKAKTSESLAATDKPLPPPAQVQSIDAEPMDAYINQMMKLGSLDADVGDEVDGIRDLYDDFDSIAKNEDEPNNKPVAAPGVEPISADSHPAPPQVPPAPGTRAPPRKLHSTRSFLNLTSREYDTLSDSEVDANEAELQARFWARAMKPAKSGNSSPYSPGRRKSVVEMSSAISPRDLEEWMQWQGESNTLDRRASGEPTDAQGDIGDQASVVAPQAYQNADSSFESLGVVPVVDDKDADGDSSDDDALQMRRPQGARNRDTVERHSDEDMEALGLSYEEYSDTEDADAESECGSCFDSIEYADIVESNKSVSGTGSSPVNVSPNEAVELQLPVGSFQEPDVLV
ncbi:hypothetical protein H4S07_005899 [Coemansia furcata]|uniref:Uncharacterized protein n=1 Tax=Coemansia furcata TaxID=417177 RepID=A0ACC1KYZ0_9FUNG|nr:hypothetical protein H4S07_005899 [Coemansia furcata]